MAADATLLFHFGFVIFAVAGGFALLLSPRWAWAHLPVVVWSSVVNLASWTCPLTPIEQHFRARSGSGSYDGGFVAHYIGPLVYPRGMPRKLELVAGVSIVAWNAVVYAVVVAILRSRAGAG